jgi:hypothetical protein
LIITRDAQQIGIALLEDLGDLNREPGDELGYIINWADDSNINSYYIISLSKKKMEAIVQIPDQRICKL